MDLSGILAGLSASSANPSIIAAAAILASLGFCKWAAKKVGTFFG